MVEIKTLSQGRVFRYEGSCKEGIKLMYGKKGYVSRVPADTLQLLLKTFQSKIVPIQTTRTVTDLKEGSLGYWLYKHIKGPVITSYLAAILIHEGYAELSEKKKLIFKEL